MRKIDGKYKTNGEITKMDGTLVPVDEPLFLFRAKDRYLLPVLEYYRRLCAFDSPEHLKAIQDQVEEIRKWQKKNPTKIPD